MATGSDSGVGGGRFEYYRVLVSGLAERSSKEVTNIVMQSSCYAPFFSMYYYICIIATSKNTSHWPLAW